MKRFFNNCELKDTGCIEWKASKDVCGYGQIYFKNKAYKAHRLSYMWANNIENLDFLQYVCHSCDNPSCVNPDHLWIGSPSDNVRDCVNKGRQNQVKKTHCKHGHEFTEENTLLKNGGGRRCKTCMKKQNKESKERWLRKK